MIARNLYQKIPMPLLRIGFSVIPYKWIIGKKYSEIRSLSEKLEFSDESELLAFQEKKLREILEYAVLHVPFYKQYKSTLKHFSCSFDAIKEFPFMTKETLSEHFDELVSDEIRKIPHIMVHTGGSTGKQLAFYHDNTMFATELAFIDTLWNRCGYQHSQKKATFRGVVFRKLPQGVYWQYNPVYNELQFSPFHMSEDKLPAYIQRLQEYKPEHLHGYPSALATLADFVLRNHITINGIKNAFCGSEPLYEEQRVKIADAFKCRVYSWYGHSERVILGGECEKAQMWHALPAYGYMELLNERDEQVKEGEYGELVGTGFWNHSMPLIRYRTDDFAVYRGRKCACGRHHELFDCLEGHRNVSEVISQHGKPISAAALNVHTAAFNHVLRYQYYQNQPGKLEIRIVPGEEFSNDDRESILMIHKRRIGDELDISIRITDDIPLTPRGKFLTVLIENKTQPGGLP